ncbi:TIM barrel protein [Pseudodesulfovibrio sp. JC047]|nr:TIM barrel protein [Pseudodesulfovibrio sp. JC047]
MDAASSDQSGPQILLSAGCLFHLPLKRIARIGREAGFVGMELIMNSPALTPDAGLESIDAILPIRSIHAPFRNWSAWGGHLNSWKATTALANWLPQADHITLHPPGTRLANMIHNRWFEKAHDLSLLLNAKGRIQFSLENMPWATGSPFSKDPFAQLMDQCRDKNVGLTFDVCHMGVSGRDVLQAIDAVPSELLYNVHYSDAVGYTEHLTPGRGALPLKAFLHRLGNRGYDRYITLELEPAAFPDSQEATISFLSDIRRTMRTHLQHTKSHPDHATRIP